MKKLFLIALTLVVATSAYAQDAVKCSAKIYAVDVYPSGGKLYMKGSVSLKKGINRIEIADIPRGAQGHTLQAGISGSGVSIHSSIIDHDASVNKPDAQIEKFYAQIDALLRDNELTNLKIKTIDEQIAILKEQCSVTDANKPSVEYVNSVVDVLGKKMNELQTARFELSSKMEANKKEVSEIDTKRKEYASRRAELSNVVAIVAQSDSEKTVSIATEFVVSGASWSPYYEVQLNGDKCEVVTKAKVVQKIGIDWNDVQVTLLSSNLSANSTALPVVHSEYIPLYVAPAYKESQMMKSSQAMPRSENLEADMVVMGYGASKKSMAVSAKNYNMQNFKLTAPYTILNGSSTDIKLTSQSVPMTMEYLIMPTSSNDAYLVANLTTSDMFNRASANIYLDGTFIGTQSLAAYQMAENGKDVVIKISLGVDKNIVFNTVNNSYKKGVVTSTDRITKIVNNKDKAVNVKIVERYPISRESTVKVEDIVISDGHTKGNGEGIINWLVNLQPKEKTEKSISYNVRDNRK